MQRAVSKALHRLALGVLRKLHSWQLAVMHPALSAEVLASLFQGGFQSEMNRREAAQILGLRESAPEDKIKVRHVAARADSTLPCS